jgi:predicted permease
MSFQISLANVLMTLFYILPGFVIGKMKKTTTSHLPTLSSVLVYVCMPCLVLSSLLSIKHSAEGLKNMGLFFVLTLLVQAAFMILVYLVIRKKSHIPKFRLMTVGMVLGNVGFFGLPIVSALLPQNPEVASYSAVYSVTMNILLFTVGVFCVTGKKEYMSLRPAVLNPTMFGFAIGFPLYLLGAAEVLPPLLIGGINALGHMSTPLCMIILGIRLSVVSLPKLFARPTVYIICLGKLILFPLFAFFAVKFLPLPYALKASMLILSATPCASVVFNIAEMHNCDAELSANCVLLSTLLCFMTIPPLTLLL